MTTHNWIDLAQDADTGIETLRAHFEGHAYDPHWHDSYLVGVTEQGVQQFNCRRARHQSTPGKVFLLEPGDIHDGEAPTADGFTYRMLYLDPQWLQRAVGTVFDNAPDNSALSFATTLASDSRLASARRMLARGEQPATVAMTLGFADQSHLGRWFVRAYGLTPALYRKRCSNLPDR